MNPKTGRFDRPLTLVAITLHKGSGRAMKVDASTIFTEANHGANGKTADRANLDSTPIDGAARPGKSVTGAVRLRRQPRQPGHHPCQGLGVGRHGLLRRLT